MKNYITKLFLIAIFSMQICASLAQKQEMANSYWRQAQAAEQIENYQQAIDLYNKCKSSTTDKYFKEDCEKKIEYLKQIVINPYLTVPEQVKMGYNGGYEKVTINSYPKKWEAEVVSGQVLELKRDGNQLLIVTLPNNSKLDPQTSVIKVTAGKISKIITVVQDASPEVLHCSSEEISPSSKGDHYLIDITTNYDNWSVVSDSTWFRISQEGKKLHIDVDPNDTPESRKGSLTIVGKDKTLVINIHQHSGDETLSFSHNNLYFSPDRESRTIGVHTNAETWYLGNSPDWCFVERVARDSVRITTVRNTSDNIPREASVSINTGLQTQSIRIYQDARPLIREREFKAFAFGVNMNLLYPMIHTSAGGDYVGSVVNYGDGNQNPSYTATWGYSLGIFADIRLHKNFYCIAELDYNYLKYRNRFNQETIYREPYRTNDYLKGNMQNSYQENYSYSDLELSLLASYRFILGNNSHIQVNLGPVLKWGLSYKLSLSGVSDSNELKVYSQFDVPEDQAKPIETASRTVSFGVDSDFDLYSSCVLWDKIYATDKLNDAITRHDKFLSSPFDRFNVGMKIGLGYEWSGISIGLSYTYMLTNMAKSDYWNNERWSVLNSSTNLMKGYNHRINQLALRLAYTFRFEK